MTKQNAPRLIGFSKIYWEPERTSILVKLTKYIALDTEIWKVVKRNPRYAISTLGRIRVIIPYKNTTKYHTIITTRIDRYGYRVVDLWQNGKVKRPRVHRLVAEAFLGPCRLGLECRHKNRDRTDARLVNLCYGTRSDNVQDAIRHGTAYFHFKLGFKHTAKSRLKIKAASIAMWKRRRNENH